VTTSLDRARLSDTLRHLDILSEAEAYGEAVPERRLALLRQAVTLRRRLWDDQNARQRVMAKRRKTQAAA
jgi:hypothetical protein